MIFRLLLFFVLLLGSSALAQDLNFTRARPVSSPVPKASPIPKVVQVPGKKINVIRPEAVVSGLSYPRFDLGLNLNPGVYSLNQTLDTVGTKFNFSNLNLLDASASFRAFFSSRFTLSAELRAEHIATTSTDLIAYELQDSSVTAISARTVLSYCMFLSSADTKLCPGLSFGYDNYPVLKFSSNTDLVLTKLGDMSIGPELLFITNLGDQIQVHLKAGYNLGLKQGQSAGYVMTADHNLFFNGEIRVPVNKTLWLAFGAGVFSQNATFTSAQDQGTWTMSNLNYTGSVGFRYNLNFLN